VNHKSQSYGDLLAAEHNAIETASSVLFTILISTPRLRVYYFLSLTLSVCLCMCSSVCHGQTSNRFFFFVSRCNRAIFWPSVLHDPVYETLFFDFWLRPHNAQNLLPKIACDNTTLPRRHPWSRNRQFSSCLEKVGNPLNFGANPCCHGNEIWPRRGDQDAYRLVTMSAAAWCRVATLQSSSEFPDFSRCFYRMR